MNKIILTDDGSHTVISEKFNATYHSVHGAIEESNVVFINGGLKYKLNQNLDSINILEIGFGTGLNAYLTLLMAEQEQKSISYTSLEPFPLSKEEYLLLNYPKLLNQENEKVFHLLHESYFDIENKISPHFSFTKVKNKVQDNISNDEYDLVYFDAFAPGCQPELWTKTVFEKMHNALKKKGALVTYCAKGEVKRTLKSCGFIIESLPGPGRKREITRAIKS